METNVNYTVVGAFVIFLLTLLVLGIIWLSAGFSTERYSTYLIKWQESVTGLSPEAAIEFNGVNVGNVKNISLNYQNPKQVDVLISIKSKTPITEGTVAMLNTRGLTGITYVALKDAGTNLTHLEKQEDEPYPIIKTAPSLFLRLDATLSKLTASLEEVSQSFQRVLDKDNQSAIKQTLANLNVLSTALVKDSKQFSDLFQHTNSIMQNVANQTLPTTNQAILHFDKASQNLASLSYEIKQNPAMLIRGRSSGSLGPGE